METLRLLRSSESAHAFCHSFVCQTGLVLVTDAIAALGLSPGLHKLGPMQVEINHEKATLKGTNTLAGRYDHWTLHFGSTDT